MTAGNIDYEPEQVRNRVLRRADWRFLLANPLPVRAVCWADSDLADAVHAISNEIVAPRAANANCDLAVAVNPNPKILRAAWQALRPGGALYSEWYSPCSGRLPTLRQKVAAAGFQDVNCYWAYPPPSRAAASFWLPIESSGALHYFFANRPQGGRLAHRWTRHLAHGVWSAALSSGWLRPVYLTARKSAAADALVTAASDRICAGWSRLLLAGGYRSTNKVVELVFAQDETAPRQVVKWPRVPEAVRLLFKEKSNLQWLECRHPDLEGVPRVLNTGAGELGLGETVLDGTPLYTKLDRATFRGLALQATDWLIRLAGNNAPRPKSAWWGRLVEPVLADFVNSFGPVLDVDSLNATRAALSRLESLPLVPEQRDFSPWNVMLAADGSLAVLDWESAELCGLPALDLVYCLTYLAFFLEGAMESGQGKKAYVRLLDASTRTGSVFAECLALYANRVGLRPEILPALRLFTWLLHARSEYGRLAADESLGPTRETLRKSLFFNLWQEELCRITVRNEGFEREDSR